MEQVFTVEVTESVARRAVAAVWKRRMGSKLLFSTGILFSVAVFLLYEGQFADSILPFGINGVLLFYTKTQYQQHLQRTLASIREHPTATYHLDERQLQIKSGPIDSAVPWSRIIDLWQFQDYWILFAGRWNYVILPTAGPTPSDLDFIRKKIKG
jgi:hypothetical protein